MELNNRPLSFWELIYIKFYYITFQNIPRLPNEPVDPPTEGAFHALEPLAKGFSIKKNCKLFNNAWNILLSVM
jgi:hypothetical protein